MGLRVKHGGPVGAGPSPPRVATQTERAGSHRVLLEHTPGMWVRVRLVGPTVVIGDPYPIYPVYPIVVIGAPGAHVMVYIEGT